MSPKVNNKLKELVIENMIKNLGVLRAMLHLTQSELAELIGMSRQNLTSIENKKRKMTWSTFLSLLFVFSQNKETVGLLEIFGIYPKELKEIYLSGN